MKEKAFLPDRSEAKTLLKLASPVLIAQLAQMGTGVVDTIMSGRYNAVDLAAIAVGYNIWLPLYLIPLGMMLAGTAIVAQDFGARRLKRVRLALPQLLWVSLALGGLLAPLCYYCEPILRLLELDADTHAKALAYLQATAFGLPGAALFQALRCHTQGVGIMRPFAVASVLGFIANIPLNYAFIYGRWGIPEMGAAGCGWATAISMWLSVVLIMAYCAWSRVMRRYMPALAWYWPKLKAVKEIVVLGTPIALTFFFEVAVFSLISLFIATLGNTAMAAHQIAFNMYDVMYMPMVAIGTAITTRIGHGIGAQDKVAVNRAVSTGMLLALAIGLGCSATMLLIPDLVAQVYTTDKVIRTLAVTLVQLAGLFVVMDALQVSAAAALRAYKDTRVPFLIMCLSYWLLALPLGYWLGMVTTDDPAQGTMRWWAGMIAGISVAAMLVCWRLYHFLHRPLPQLSRQDIQEMELAE